MAGQAQYTHDMRFAVVSHSDDVAILYFQGRTDAMRYYDKQRERHPESLWLLLNILASDDE